MSASPDESLSTTAARDSFAEVVNRAAYGKERVVLTRRGKPLVAVVPIEDVALLEGLEDERDSALVRERVADWEAAGRPGKLLEDYIRERGLEVGESEA
ncbi:MAG: type II toxin-antitoxin system Phd/YefM family antitoxin [Burkholderiales bacterium]